MMIPRSWEALWCGSYDKENRTSGNITYGKISLRRIELSQGIIPCGRCGKEDMFRDELPSYTRATLLFL